LGQVHSLEERIGMVEWHRNWGRGVQKRIKPLPAAPALHMPRKWRIGFLSSDLRNHPVTYFCMPLLEAYDRDRFDVFCYSFYEGERDAIQAEIEKSVNFRWWPYRPDDQVAADIAKDNLDLLFELGGSTAMNKLEVMAYRPARLGGSWLGYPHSAGLETIDYILVDPYIKPEDPRLLIEKPFELPETWVTVGGRLGFYEVPIDLETPEDRRGYVTFGTANNPYKYTTLCIDTWAAVLRRVPNSRFIFIRPEAGGPSFLENTRAAFAARNVDPDRICWHSRQAHAALQQDGYFARYVAACGRHHHLRKYLDGRALHITCGAGICRAAFLFQPVQCWAWRPGYLQRCRLHRKSRRIGCRCAAPARAAPRAA
jgi:predicted O-linked N-acetylglucosamine transferase (SPINDLY family)